MRAQVRAFIEQGLRREETLLDFIEAREKDPAPDEYRAGPVCGRITCSGWLSFSAPLLEWWRYSRMSPTHL